MNLIIRQSFKNFAYLISSQVITLLISTLISLFFPKIMDVRDFGYWQLFIFYSSYIGFFHFGFNDGIYLRYGGQKFEKRNLALLGKELRVFFLFEFFIALLFFLYGFFYVEDETKKYIFFLLSFYLIFNNILSFFNSLYQTINRIKEYSVSVYINKLFFFVSIIILLILKVKSSKPYIFIYVFANFLSLMYMVIFNWNLIANQHVKKTYITKEIRNNIGSGFLLMLSNVVSLLIVGIGRYNIEHFWSLEDFSKVSLLLTIVSFFLIFISQISIVLFPMLKQFNKVKLRLTFEQIRNFLNITLSLMLISFPLIYIFLDYWLPYYKDVFIYLNLFLILCVFDGKMQILYSTYLKTLRKEKELFYINFFSLTLSLIITFLGVYVHNITFIIYGMVFSVVLRSLISEIYLSSFLKINFKKSVLFSLTLTFVFLVSSTYFSLNVGTSVVLFFLLIYIYLNKEEVMGLYRILFKK